MLKEAMGEESKEQAVIETKFAKDSLEALAVHTNLMKLHYRAIGCHSEIMGMMSENMLCACSGAQPMFGIIQFSSVLKKWGMMDKDGNPII